MHTLATRLAPVAAILLALSSPAYAAKGGGHGGHNHGRDSNRDFIWRHENGCAIGNTPPPNVTCPGRDDQRKN